LCLALVAGNVYAESNRNSGCGLGSMIIENQSTVLMQVLAATTNGTSGNQTFGISSGTSNCDQPSNWVQNERLNRFVAENMDSLAGDIAQGQGEYLSTLATLMEVPEDQRPEFYSNLQNNFSNIYTSETVNSADVIDNIRSVMIIG
jgi:hypothetical protein